MRKRSKEIPKAESQRIQEKVHQILYCDTDSDEHEIYGHRFQKIIERSELNESQINVNNEIVDEFKKCIGKKLKGEEPLDKTLVFFQILNILYNQPMCKEKIVMELENYSKDCINLNLLYLEKSCFIEKNSEEYKLSNQ